MDDTIYTLEAFLIAIKYVCLLHYHSMLNASPSFNIGGLNSSAIARNFKDTVLRALL